MFLANKLNKGAGAAAAPTDAKFNYVTMLLHGDGTNGAQNNTFVDSSTNNFTITRNGNTTQGSFSPYGSNWSNYFDGTSTLAFPSNSAFAFGTGAYTVEMWVFVTGVGSNGYSHFFNAGNATGSFGFAIESNYSLNVFGYGVGGVITGSANDITPNTWQHIAVCRSSTSSNDTKIYVNGVLKTTGTDSTNWTVTTTPAVGGITNLTGYSTIGYISNCRVVKGTAVYTSAFTPSTTPLTAISGTSLLTCADNRFVDDSTNNFTITVNGTPSVQRFNPFGTSTAYSTSVIGGSGYFDGSGDSLSSASNFEASTSTTTFTIEGFVYPTTFSSLINIIGGIATTSGDTKSIAAEVNTSGQVALYWYDGAIKRCTGNTVMQLNAWNYFAIVVSSNSISIYVNKTTTDTLSGTTTLTNRTQLQGLGVGAYYNNNTPAQYFNGYLANLRYSTIARTISSLPTTPFASDTNTRWLLSYTNAGILDNAMMNDLETVGNAQISTSVVKYGTGSIYFDGTGDSLSVLNTPTSTVWGTESWTIEGWIYPTAVSSSYRTIYANGFPVQIFQTGGSVEIYISSTNGYSYIVNGLTGPASSVTANTWVHFAVVKNGSAYRVYVNGVGGSTVTDSTAIALTSTPNAIIGDAPFGSYPFVGYMDDLRITKGYARYTTTFTPPTAAFPNTGPV